MQTFVDNEPVIVERAEGRELIDVAGRRYLDAISSLWVNTLGHHVPELDQALIEQLGKVAHSTMLGNGNATVIELAEALAEVVPVDRPHFLFASDGAAAVEQALKMAFQYWVNLSLGPGRVPQAGAASPRVPQAALGQRHTFLVLGQAYHGDTVGSLSLGDRGFGTEIFDPLRFQVLRTPGYDDPGWLEKALQALHDHADRLAAVVIEPLVQAASGMLVARPEDVRSLADAVAHAGSLLICDEVATGFGRTGALFASELCGIRPDILCLGKAITGGYLPMSATVANQRVFEAFLGEDLGPRTFYHGHSYGGNALAAAVALAHLAILRQSDVLENARARAEQLARELDAAVVPHRLIQERRQQGLLCGLQADGSLLGWKAGLLGRKLCAGAVRRGVLLRPLGDVVVVVAPLTVTEQEITRIVSAIAGALEEVDPK
jgi:adenosylmethionine-8-amino-7-oxononanoate aminotransferase